MATGDVTHFESYRSKNGQYEFSICFVDGFWDVDCWYSEAGDNSQLNDNHWHVSFRDEAKAKTEFNRWRDQ